MTVKSEDERLDTLDPGAVGRWARDGWARKSALVHDGCLAVTGHSWTGYWIVVEALTVEQLGRGWTPRVSVVRDAIKANGILRTTTRALRQSHRKMSTIRPTSTGDNRISAEA